MKASSSLEEGEYISSLFIHSKSLVKLRHVAFMKQGTLPIFDGFHSFGSGVEFVVVLLHVGIHLGEVFLQRHLSVAVRNGAKLQWRFMTCWITYLQC